MAKNKNPRRYKRTGTKETTGRIPRWTWLVGGIAVMVLVVIGLFYLGNQEPPVAGDIEGLVILPELGRDHQEGDINYVETVPAGGTHNSIWQNCGIYDQPVRAENVIHSMEHGAVWLAYRPDLPAEQVDTLRELVRQERSRVRESMIILAPKPDLDVPIVATAWRAQLELEEASDERLAQFVQRFQRGPYTPEHGASCVNGVGQPLS